MSMPGARKKMKNLKTKITATTSIRHCRNMVMPAGPASLIADRQFDKQVISSIWYFQDQKMKSVMMSSSHADQIHQEMIIHIG